MYLKSELDSEYSIVVFVVITNAYNSIKIQIGRYGDIHPYPHSSCTYTFMQADA